MKLLWLHIIRTYLKIGLFCYYKSFQVYNVQNIPKNKPVLFLANHQNALIDPLLIAAKSGRFLYFLTRASVFKKSLISKLLHSFQMLPVYRVRDGWSSISNNNSIFLKCTDLLHANNAIVIFPEGNHHIKRTVRPLSKGFTRIVFETLSKYPDTNLQIIPVGINYTKTENFVDSTAVYFGKPIAAKNYLLANKNEAIINLKKDVFQAITKLTTHIPTDNYAKIVKELKQQKVDFLNPEAVNTCIASNFTDCQKKVTSKNDLLKQIIKYVLLVNFFLPVIVWKKLIKPKIKQVEFIATFRFAIYITLFPIWFFILVSVLFLLVDFQIAVCYALVVSVLALFYVKT